MSANLIAYLERQAIQHWDSWGCYKIGQKTDREAQVTVTVNVVRVRPELVEWAANAPDDLVRINAWLDPTRSGPPLMSEL